MFFRLKLKLGTKVNLRAELAAYIGDTSSRVFFGVPFTPSGYIAQQVYSKRLNLLLILTYFLPVWLIQKIYNKNLSAIKLRAGEQFIDEIQTYRRDKSKNSSYILR